MSEAPEVAPRRRKHVVLRWTGEGEVFRGGAPGGVEIPIDGGGRQGPSPMDALLLSLAGCMGADVLMILQKGRVPVASLEVEIVGERRETPPRRYTSLTLAYRVGGPSEADQAKLDRAVALSRDTYCSVFHTLRPDLDVTFRIDRV